jgi:DNA-binding transcriptional LysR family regulator
MSWASGCSIARPADGTPDRGRPAAPGLRARLLGLASEAQTAIQELQQVRRGRVIMGANEAAVHSLLPHVERFAVLHPKVAIEVRRVPSRQIAGAVLDRTLDFGVLTFLPVDRGVQTILLGGDDIVLLTAPTHRLADRRKVTIEESARRW